MDGITATMAWSIKTINHTVLEELLLKLLIISLMDNSKMVVNMDTSDGYIKKVHVTNYNIKMERKFDKFDYHLCVK